ncbi:MAG TPA: class I SAM-dependent methyltransferase [Bacteroidia bacterium]|nr:class I SAM-dependent methyltransferase [Bacteroidia bacterium]HRB24988.1 class I SAM-dependent methyltransferase [Bacteroidia bacterium]
MPGSLSIALQYISYYVKAWNKHSVHSPFVYKLTTQVIHPDKKLAKFIPIEQQRILLKQSTDKIFFTELGAGNKSNKRSVSEIAAKSLKFPRYARLLYRLANHFQPDNIIELGTSLGITTGYMALSGCKNIFTIDGNKTVSEIAQSTLTSIKLHQNIKFLQGNFDEALPALLHPLNKIDFVFFDGNHRYQPTINYFHQCLTKAHDKSVFVFDDINYSQEMKQAWHEIKQHPSVIVSIDLFMMGIVFFDTDLLRQHFVIRY